MAKKNRRSASINFAAEGLHWGVCVHRHGGPPTCMRVDEKAWVMMFPFYWICKGIPPFAVVQACHMFPLLLFFSVENTTTASCPYASNLIKDTRCKILCRGRAYLTAHRNRGRRSPLVFLCFDDPRQSHGLRLLNVSCLFLFSAGQLLPSPS